jgi:lysophospholipase L1-like esterase
MVLEAVFAALYQREHVDSVKKGLSRDLRTFTFRRMKNFFLLLIAAASLVVHPGNSFGQDINQAVNSAIVPAPRPGGWMKRHENFLEQAKQDQIDLLFVGDSITDFWRGKAPRFGTNIWSKYYAPLHTADFGISGDRTENVIWRIDNGELDGLHPKVIVLMIGTNNSRTNSPEQIAEGIKVILNKMQEKCPDSKILLLGVFPRNTLKDIPAQIEAPAKINAIISKYADGKKIVYLNINDKFLGPDGKVPADIMPDFLHPNEHGYQLWADAMNPTLFGMMK